MYNNHHHYNFHKLLLTISIIVILFSFCYAQTSLQTDYKKIDISGFDDCAHHWKDITDHEQFIIPILGQKRYDSSQVKEIADNILLYQQKNGGWPKNYDMLAILTSDQKNILSEKKDSNNTTFDNGATHSQVEYLAKAFYETKIEKYKSACLSGINFILRAQYNNGGWPQFYPDTSSYRKYITFNDDVMIGNMEVLHHIIQNKPEYSFVDISKRSELKKAFYKGIDCILKCQIVENNTSTVWCQQHDEINYQPRGARTFEIPSKCGKESADIVLLLMSINNPSPRIIKAIKAAVKWFSNSKILGIRVKTLNAPKIVYKFRTSVTDKMIIKDSNAPPIWARFYSLRTNKPFFCDRNGIPVDSLSMIGRERRDGYGWYTYDPQKVFDKYAAWIQKINNQN